MYKKNSQNMQRRTSRIATANISASATDMQKMALSNKEKRDALCAQKEALSKRVVEIRGILGIKKGIQHKLIKGNTVNTPEYKEWGEIAKKLKQIDAEIKEIPITRSCGKSRLIIEYFSKHHPEIYQQAARYAKNQIDRGLVISLEES